MNIYAIAGIALAGAFLFSGGGEAANPARAVGMQVAGTAAVPAAKKRIVTLKVKNLYCATCPYIVRRALLATPGVSAAVVSYRDKTATVTYDASITTTRKIIEATTNVGFPSALITN